jgi:putative glutathione S-transferase
MRSFFRCADVVGFRKLRMASESGKKHTVFSTLANEKGDYVRKASVFRNFVTVDGSSGFPAERDRYHLYVSLACPWAHRTLIYR